MRGLFITFRDKVPALAAGEFSKEPTGVVRAHGFGMLGKTEEGQPLAVALADQPLSVGLLEEGEEACSVVEVCGHDVGEHWCVVRGFLGRSCWIPGVLGSNVVREAPCFFKAIEK